MLTKAFEGVTTQELGSRKDKSETFKDKVHKFDIKTAIISIP